MILFVNMVTTKIHLQKQINFFLYQDRWIYSIKRNTIKLSKSKSIKYLNFCESRMTPLVLLTAWSMHYAHITACAQRISRINDAFIAYTQRHQRLFGPNFIAKYSSKMQPTEPERKDDWLFVTRPYILHGESIRFSLWGCLYFQLFLSGNRSPLLVDRSSWNFVGR